MDPRTELTYKPVGKDEKPEKPAYLQFLEKKREKDQAKLKRLAGSRRWKLNCCEA
jgi:hypothetical protein